MDMEMEARLYANMATAKRLGVDLLSGDIEDLGPRMRAALAAWRAEVGDEVVEVELERERAKERARLRERAEAEEAERKRTEQAQRWEAFDGAASVVERHAAALDCALQEAADVRRLLAEACALAVARFPGASGMVSFLELRDAQRVVEHAVLQAGAGVAPESVAGVIRGGLELLAKVRIAAEASA